jgi:hypothetical protein
LQVSGVPGRDYGSGASEILAMAVKWRAISVSLILLCVELLSLTSGGHSVAVNPSSWELCGEFSIVVGNEKKKGTLASFLLFLCFNTFLFSPLLFRRPIAVLLCSPIELCL